MRRHLSVVAISILLTLMVSACAAAGQDDIPKLVKKIQPAVVTVIAYDASGRVKGQGTGFFIIKNGAFITNYHVLAKAPRARVQTANGQQYPVAKIVVEDKAGDLVVGAVNPPKEGFPILKMSATLPEAGERVVVVGSPLGLEQTISDGVVSGTRQLSGVGDILQISAPISPGSSGSPVVNLRGEVVGVATLQIVKGQNLNFAIPGYRVLALQQRAAKTKSDQKPDFGQERDTELATTVGDKVLFMPFEEQNPGPSAKRLHGPAKGFYEKAEIFFRDGHHQKAAVAYKEAIRFQPDYANLHVKLGWMYLVLHSPQEAIVAFKQGIYLNSKCAEAYSGLGQAYECLSRNQEALEAYKQSIRLKPNSAEAHFNLGTFYLSMGNRGAALEEYEILQTLNKSLSNILFGAIYR